jgi:hypothetical protein
MVMAATTTYLRAASPPVQLKRMTTMRRILFGVLAATALTTSTSHAGDFFIGISKSTPTRSFAIGIGGGAGAGAFGPAPVVYPAYAPPVLTPLPVAVLPAIPPMPMPMPIYSPPVYPPVVRVGYLPPPPPMYVPPHHHHPVRPLPYYGY